MMKMIMAFNWSRTWNVLHLFIKELIGLILCTTGLVYAINTGDWAFFPGMAVGAGLVLICWNFINFTD